MSVYTELTSQQVSDFITQFSLGDFVSHKGISAGVENSNFFVTTSIGEFVLTLFEQHNTEQVEVFVAIARHLAEADELAVPCPIADKQNVYLHQLEGKPAILCPRLEGEHPSKISKGHCYLIGQALARFHKQGQSFEAPPINDRSLSWWKETAQLLRKELSDQQQQLLAVEIHFQEQSWSEFQLLPSGLIHGDLFHDNALFTELNGSSNLGAVLDIYNACQGVFIYDVAIVANDWCAEKEGHFNQAKIDQLFLGYESVREFTKDEKGFWQQAKRAAALRFWLSRLMTQKDQRVQRENKGLTVITEKDPQEYQAKLLSLQGNKP